MIRYTLTCTDGHDFESWFKSSDAFETLHASKQVVCPMCGTHKVSKTLMAPGVAAKGNSSKGAKRPMAAGPDPKLEKALKDLKDHVEKNSDYVGNNFADEARAMHLGEKPERSIYGEAKIEDAKKLHDDGIAAVPLPFTPKNKTN